MTREQRIRRVAILCCHFLRNLAFYRAGWKHTSPRRLSQFWINANGNFLDVCVLEWCKVFAERRGKHHWHQVVTDKPAFKDGLLKAVGKSEEEFERFAQRMREYRNRFIAHLDDYSTMQIPHLRAARKSMAYLYNYLIRVEDTGGVLAGAHPSAFSFYSLHAKEGHRVYATDAIDN